MTALRYSRLPVDPPLTNPPPCTTLSCMSKTEVYSWRVDPELKAELEAVARAEKTSVGGLLERASKDMLTKRKKGLGSRDQARRRKALLEIVEKYAIDGPGISATNANVRQVMGEHLEAKYGKRRSR